MFLIAITPSRIFINIGVTPTASSSGMTVLSRSWWIPGFTIWFARQVPGQLSRHPAESGRRQPTHHWSSLRVTTYDRYAYKRRCERDVPSIGTSVHPVPSCAHRTSV